MTRSAGPLLDATSLLKVYAGLRSYLLDIRDPVESQRLILEGLTRRARATRFGREHQFSLITDVADFQKRVRLRRYEEFWRDYWQPDFPHLADCTWPGTIRYFARTSGTTAGVSKYIPCSEEMIAANLRAGEDVFVHHVLNRPQSQVLAGKCLLLGGSTDLTEEAPGIHSGDLSGIEVNELPSWKRPWFFPSRELALIPDWEDKIDRIARACLEEDIRTISGTPNWLLLFFDKLAQVASSGGVAEVFPRLELVIHGGIDFAPYRDRFRRLLEGTRAETREVYFASESSIAVADRGDGEGLRLICDNDTFFEFVPLGELGSPKATRHWIATIETGVEYAVVVSTCAGAWAYVLGDTVRFIERDQLPAVDLRGARDRRANRAGRGHGRKRHQRRGRRLLRRRDLPRGRDSRRPSLRRRIRRGDPGCATHGCVRCPAGPGARRGQCRLPGAPRRRFWLAAAADAGSCARNLRSLDEEPRPARRPAQGAAHRQRCETLRKPSRLCSEALMLSVMK
jgi:hypothetical protein